MPLHPHERLLYAQQMALTEIGEAGQLKLKQAKVLCIGAGGLGSPLLQYLAAAGVGTIGIIDHDVVEASNLQRQIIYQYQDIGRLKVEAAHQHLSALNPFINIEIYAQRFTRANAHALASQYDIIADCTDQLNNRYLVNDICLALNKPFVFAGIWRYQGQCMLFHGKEGPCFHCLFPADAGQNALPDCRESGVLGVLPGMLGCMQANLVLQYLLQIRKPVSGRLFCVDSADFAVHELHLTKDQDCAACVHGQTIIDHDAMTYEEYTAFTGLQLLDVRSAEEHAARSLGGKLIPLPELTQRIHELDPAVPLLVYCHSGPRSKRALAILREHKFQHVRYLEGGIASSQSPCAMI